MNTYGCHEKGTRGQKSALNAKARIGIDHAPRKNKMRCNMGDMTQDTLPTPSYTISGEFDAAADIVVHLGDTLEFLKNIPSETANLIITSPPYNVGKSYRRQAKLRSVHRFSIVCGRRVGPDATPARKLVLASRKLHRKEEVYPLDIQFYPIFKERGLKLRNRIIWHVGHGMHERRRFSGRYETILWFTKGDDYTFNLDSV